MENRTVIIKDTRTQQLHKIMSSAVTLGQLIDQMEAQGIRCSDMVFNEGISNTTMVDRSSLLPTNMMYRGKVTNNLAIRLMMPDKNIASGNDPSRQELYDVIEERGLQKEIEDKFGKDYTQVTTEKLLGYITEYTREKYNDLFNTISKVKSEVDEEELPTFPMVVVDAMIEGYKKLAKELCLPIGATTYFIGELSKFLEQELSEV